ncbi:MAG: HlyC/CorC family transporter [Desulfobacterales bacterium]|nr:HlyC/CorC family transporter [Desulfobacterales bacterium]
MNDTLILISLLFLSGAFSGSETALTAVTLARAEALQKGGQGGSKALLQLKKQSTNMLITLLIGNNLVNIGASAFATVVATEYLGALGPGVAVGVLTFLILVFGEITPKSLAIRHSIKVSLAVAPVVLLLMRILFPLVWMFSHLISLVHKMTDIKEAPTVTETELVHLLRYGTEEGTIEKGEANIIERVFAFNDLVVADVMTPRHKMFSLSEEITIKEALPKIVEVGFSRVPVYSGSVDNISYIVHWHDIATAIANNEIDKPLKEIGIEPIFALLNQPIDRLFYDLKRKKRHLSIVVDEHGELRGVVSMENLLEELVGEIYDESDRKRPSGITELDDGIEVDGGVELGAISEYTSVDVRGKNTDSVSRWIVNDIERIPRTDEQFEIDGLTVEIRQASGRRIHKVKIKATSTRDSSESEQ